MSGEDNIREIDAYRKRRRGCYFRLIGGWFGLMFAIIIVMVIVRGCTLRDDHDALMAEINQEISIDLPETFFPYSRTNFFGARVISIWSDAHLGEDGRNTSVIALFRKNSWRGKSLEAVRDERLAVLEELLDQNEFRIRARREKQFVIDGEEIVIYYFSGLQRMEYGLKEATTCYRFLEGAKGPLQIQTIGLDKFFDAEAQFEVLKSIKSK